MPFFENILILKRFDKRIARDLSKYLPDRKVALTVRIDYELWEQVTRRARRLGKSKTELVSELIMEFVSKK